MTKRLTIPRNPGEAERFLWHVMDHLGGFNPSDDPNNAKLDARNLILDLLNKFFCSINFFI
jgi:hypothetical protein